MTYRIQSSDLNHTRALACLPQLPTPRADDAFTTSLGKCTERPAALSPSFQCFHHVTQKVLYLLSIVLCQALTLHRDLLIVIQIIHCGSEEGNKLIH